MKKVFLMLFLIVFGMVGCNGQETEATTTEVVYENYVSIVIGDDTHSLGFNHQDDTLFDLIQSSNINLDFEDTEYGPMVSEIGEYQQDEFHWISFTKNSEYAESGLDSIEYQDGDVFQFLENMSTWDQTFTAELNSIDGDLLSFEIGNYEVLINKTTLNSEEFYVGGNYTMTGQPSSITNNEVIFTVSDFTANFEHISIIIGDNTYDLLYEVGTDKSAFELIDDSDIELEYITTQYGPMITRIGDLQQDDFHWLSFMVNDEFASSGLDTLEYHDGDVITFTEEIATWEVNVKAEIIEINQDEIIFQNENQAFIVEVIDLPETVVVGDLVVGFLYNLTGLVDAEASNEIINFIPSSLELNVVTDFTSLYELEVGDVVILQFTVTYIEDSSEFGIEIYAEDINGLSSTEISSSMSYSSATNYIFYTIPSDYDLVVNQTYIGRFIYQINEPSQIPQITLYEQSINGEEIDSVIVE
ncbi:MAG: DUF4430 domain-containing protein [Tenericutes bacterium]|jgi:hypothetical protein|nr:DUF4430 domain-containing protein [Mycoplasmatota bacterium]